MRFSYPPSVASVIPTAMVAMTAATQLSNRSAPIPAVSPAQSPTRSAMVAGLRGSSSGISDSTLPTRSAPMSAALLKMPPPTRAKRAMLLAPIANPLTISANSRKRISSYTPGRRIPNRKSSPVPTTATEATASPATAPPLNAVRSAAGSPGYRAASAVRTLARTAAKSPENAASMAQTAPPTNAAAVRTPAATNSSSAATTMNAASTRPTRRANASAPDWICAASARITSFPGGSLRSRSQMK
jgi:hypothetical protein